MNEIHTAISRELTDLHATATAIGQAAGDADLSALDAARLLTALADVNNAVVELLDKIEARR